MGEKSHSLGLAGFISRWTARRAAGPGMIAGGWLTPPVGPGLGVELDWDAVKSMMVEL